MVGEADGTEEATEWLKRWNERQPKGITAPRTLIYIPPPTNTLTLRSANTAVAHSYDALPSSVSICCKCTSITQMHW